MLKLLCLLAPTCPRESLHRVVAHQRARCHIRLSQRWLTRVVRTQRASARRVLGLSLESSDAREPVACRRCQVQVTAAVEVAVLGLDGAAKKLGSPVSFMDCAGDDVRPIARPWRGFLKVCRQTRRVVTAPAQVHMSNLEILPAKSF